MHSIFVTQIYQRKLSFDLKDLKLEIRQIMKADLAGQQWSEKNYQQGYTSYGSWDQMHRMSSNFEALQKKIDKQVIFFCKSLGFSVAQNALVMNSCWVNVMPEQAYHGSHIHPHAVLSGSFYVDVPKDASTLKFEDPRLGLFMNAPTIKPSAKKQNQRFFSVQPRNGDLILFESWLRHEVPLNKSRQPRVSISFNYGWK